MTHGNTAREQKDDILLPYPIYVVYISASHSTSKEYYTKTLNATAVMRNRPGISSMSLGRAWAGHTISNSVFIIYRIYRLSTDINIHATRAVTKMKAMIS